MPFFHTLLSQPKIPSCEEAKLSLLQFWSFKTPLSIWSLTSWLAALPIALQVSGLCPIFWAISRALWYAELVFLLAKEDFLTKTQVLQMKAVTAMWHLNVKLVSNDVTCCAAKHHWSSFLFGWLCGLLCPAVQISIAASSWILQKAFKLITQCCQESNSLNDSFFLLSPAVSTLCYVLAGQISPFNVETADMIYKPRCFPKLFSVAAGLLILWPNFSNQRCKANILTIQAPKPGHRAILHFLLLLLFLHLFWCCLLPEVREMD